MAYESFLSALLSDSPTCLWLANEGSGAVAADHQGNHSGTYTGSGFSYLSVALTAGLPSLSITNATSDNVVADHTDFTPQQAFSYEILLKTPSSITVSYQSTIDKHNSSAGYLLATEDVDSGILFQFGDGTVAAGNGYVIGAAGWPSASTVYLIVITYDHAGHQKIYLDGSEVSYTSTTNHVGSSPPNYTGAMGIGGDGGATRTCSGWLISATAFYKSVLSSSRVLAHYNAFIAAKAPRASANNFQDPALV